MHAEYVDHLGTDLSVVNAARVSFSKRSDWRYEEDPYDPTNPAQVGLREADAKLIRYLAKHGHWTPFAHTAITLRMKSPVPIRTQCFKHKAGFVENEESRRYISSTPELWVPEVLREKPKASIKQGSAGAHPQSASWIAGYKAVCGQAIEMYLDMINAGVCPEQARCVLPQGVYVNWYWTGNLAGYARFYNQRKDPHAQSEVRDLADLVADIIRPLYPVAWEALTLKE